MRGSGRILRRRGRDPHRGRRQGVRDPDPVAGGEEISAGRGGVLRAVLQRPDEVTGADTDGEADEHTDDDRGPGRGARGDGHGAGEAERPGVYCRVIDTGAVTVGDPVSLIAYTGATVSVIENFRAFYDKETPEATIRRLLAAPIAIRDRQDNEKRLQAFSTPPR